jgi:hypothetical protein
MFPWNVKACSSWCDTPHGRTAEPYLDRTMAIQAGLRRAAHRAADEEADHNTRPITAAAPSTARAASSARACTSAGGKPSRIQLATRVR